MLKLWSFLWRFAAIGLPLWWVTGWLIGTVTVALGGDYSDASTIFAVAQWLGVLPVAAFIAWLST